MGKRILVTGGTGFIGRVLLSYLRRDPNIDLIDIVDNLSNSGYHPHDPLFNNSGPRINMYVQDVSTFEPSPHRLYHEIYHLASPVGPVGVLKHAGHMGPMIIADTARMAELALQMNAKLIDISTSEVYGRDPQGVPQQEDIDKIVPANNTVRLEYGVSKLACEVFLKNQVKIYGLRCKIIRPYNIVSVGQSAPAGFVLPRFCKQALAGDPITVYKPGSQRRTFTHVKDFVEGMILVMDKGKYGEVYNLGNPDNLHPIKELAQAVKDGFQSQSEIQIVNPKKIHGDLFAGAWEKIPDITKAKTDLGWNPTRKLTDIVQEAVNYYQGGNYVQ